MRIGPGGKLLLVLLGLGILAYTLERHVGHRRLLAWVQLPFPAAPRLTSGDFPPGAEAPVGNLAQVPQRPVRIVALSRGSAAPLLVAAGGVGARRDSPASRSHGLPLEMTFVPDEPALVRALTDGGEREGADAAALSLDRLAQLRASLPEASLKAVMLLGHSRGFEALASTSAVDQVPALRGRRVAVSAGSPARYFLMWELAQALLSPGEVTLVPAVSSADAARLLAEGRADAAAGALPDLAGPARELGGQVIATTADAPHLSVTVLVVRGAFLARYPDAARRLVRAAIEAAEAARADPTEAARLLAATAPLAGDPFEALRLDPPATLDENLAFFGVRGDAPVRYEESYASAAGLWRKLGEPADPAQPADSRDLGPLLSVAANPPPSPPARPSPSRAGDAGAPQPPEPPPP